MRQRVMVLIGVVTALVASLLVAKRAGVLSRVAPSAEEPQERQWPFDPTELRNLMDGVIDQQQSHISEMAPGPERDRAVSFLEYYQRRRAAALS